MFSAPSFAAISVSDNDKSTEKTGGNSSAVTQSITLNASADYLEVCVSAHFLFDITAVSWNGVSMTQSVELANGSYPVASQWYLPNPDTGTHTLSISTDIDTQGMFISWLSLSGAENQAPDVTTSGTGLNESLTTLVDGSIVVDCAATNAVNSSFVETGDLSTNIINQTGTAVSAFSNYLIKSTAGLVDGSFTYTGTGSMPHTMLSIAPAAGGAATTFIIDYGL